MSTQESATGQTEFDEKRSEILSRCRLCAGLPRELPKSKRPGSDRDVFALTDPTPLYVAMFCTLAYYQHHDMEPGAERLVADTRHARPRLLEDIRQAWLTIVKVDDVFPWHEDYLFYSWAKLRRMTNQQKRAACEWIGIDIPEKWKTSDVVEAA